jgi:LysM repeat protein
MKLFISICLFILLFLNVQQVYSQKEVGFSGNTYLLHKVKKSETIYGLCQKYKVTQEELKAANFGLTSVLNVGDILKIPVKKEVATQKPDQQSVNAVATEPEYYYHKVTKRQTIFSISRQYGITANELIRYNPEISSGLNEGHVLKIPVLKGNATDSSGQPVTGTGNIKVSQDTQSLAEFRFHTVVAGETLYSLEQRYAISREELIRLNPALQNGLQTGTRLRIPERKREIFSVAPTSKPDSVIIAEAEPENLNCNPISGRNTQKYKAALLLPFYLQGNEQYYPSDRNNRMLVSKIERGKLSQLLHSGGTDTIASKSTAKIDPRAESFIEFYEGVLLAIDSLQQKGMNIELYVFDATNQKMINALLQLDEFRDLDLIIGPVHPEIQESVAAFAAKNRIPMISPLASTGDFENNNSWYFKVNPTREYQIEQTAQYIADEFRNKNFVLLPMGGGSNSTEAKLAELGKIKLLAARQSSNNRGNLFHEYSFQKNGLSGVKPLLDENGENIFIIPTDNEAQVSVAVTNLNAIAEKFNVVLIGTSNLIKLKSIQTENYHHIRLRYLSPTFIDYTKPLVRRFVSHYRSTFSTEPSQFSHQGFDVSYYFLSALFQYGKDFRGCLPDYPMELTQTVFNFRKVAPMGGFMNYGMFVTSFERNYDVLNYGTVGTTKKVNLYQ